MGCDCCNKWDTNINDCLASQSYRDNFCGVGRDVFKKGSNYTPPKKKRNKVKKQRRHG